MRSTAIARRIPAVLAVCASLAMILTGCSSQEQVKPDPSASDFHTIHIGKGRTSETRAVAALYADILQQAGYRTELVDSGDSRAEELKKMQTGESPIDLLPEYSGNLLLALTDGGRTNPRAEDEATAQLTTSSAEAQALASLHPSESASPSASPSSAFNVNGMSSSDITGTLRSVLPKGITTLDAASAENKDALVITRVTAAKYGISTIDDLAEHCKDLAFGVPEGFSGQTYGTQGLKKLYQCAPGRYVQSNDQEKLVDDLADNSVQVADVYTASSAIDTNDFVVLEDPNANFVAQQVTPVAKENLPDSAKDAINHVSGKLKTDDLKFLNRLYTGDDPVSPEDAAKFWLEHDEN